MKTARFWASRAEFDRDGRAHIRQVIGPDEYHEMVDDSAYTNTMAKFNLERAADALAFLEGKQNNEWQHLSARFGLTDGERVSWEMLAAALITGFDPSTKRIEQFAGFFQLEELNVAAQAMPFQLMCSLDRSAWTARRSSSRRMLSRSVALLWDQWPLAVHETNFRYYEPRTAHGSSLSPALHALVAARIGDFSREQAYFRQAAEIDLSNNMGNAGGGVHMGALGGLWQAAVFGIAGVQVRESRIAVDPHLLPGWLEITFPLQWRGRLLRVRVEADPRRIEIAVAAGEDLNLAVVDGPTCLAHSGRRYVLQPGTSGWERWEEAG